MESKFYIALVTHIHVHVLIFLWIAIEIHAASAGFGYCGKNSDKAETSYVTVFSIFGINEFSI
jgi:hypothetical protein